MSTTLVIGDAHVNEETTFSRFEALGRLIVDRQPDTILSIGDFMDFRCLSAWDANKRLKMEGKRYTHEIQAGNTALDLTQGPTLELQDRQRAAKRKLYSPTWVYLSGNHEWRSDRYIEQHPELEGQLDYRRELRLKARGFIHVPFKEYYYHEGVAFTHIPISGNGNPRSGTIYNQLQHALQDHSTSIVMGHGHKLAVAGIHRHGGEHYNQALMVGCFFNHVDEYAKGAASNYWRGLVMLDHYSPGRFDIETIAMRRLLEMY